MIRMTWDTLKIGIAAFIVGFGIVTLVQGLIERL